MPPTLTTNYSFVKPEIGVVGTPQWSEELNDDLDSLDTVIKDIQDQIDVLAPDAPVDLSARVITLERLLLGRRTIQRVAVTGSTTIDLDDIADGHWVTKTGSAAATVTLSAPSPDQTVVGTADGTFVMQEGYLIIQNFGSATVSFTAIGASLAWVDGDGGGISPQSCPGGLLRFYKYLAFVSSGSSDTPPSNRIYIWRTAL